MRIIIKIINAKFVEKNIINLIQKVKNQYEERNKELTKELRKIYEYKRKLQGDIYENKYGKKMTDTTLIDK